MSDRDPAYQIPAFGEIRGGVKGVFVDEGRGGVALSPQVLSSVDVLIEVLGAEISGESSDVGRLVALAEYLKGYPVDMDSGGVEDRYVVRRGLMRMQSMVTDALIAHYHGYQDRRLR